MAKNQKGFTLIELLVVIAIIGLLAAIIAVSVNSAREKARDAQRVSGMNQIQIALELYYDDNESYPNENSSNGGWEHSYEDGGDFIDFLLDQGYMPTVSIDPINTAASGQYYSYYLYPAGSYGCDASLGQFYVLGVEDMETSGRPHPDSPGWNCPTRNWQNEFDWVTGAFEY